jgi:hypothetical protein
MGNARHRAGDRASPAADAPRGTVPYLPVLWEIALEGERQASEAEEHGAPYVHASGAFTAIVFATVTIEAYPAHLLAETLAELPWCAEVDRALVERVVERQRAGGRRIERCYARAAGGGQKEALWFQRTACLRELRNELVQFRAVPDAVGAWPPRLLERGGRELISGWLEGPAFHWTSQVLRAGVARWACATTRMAIEALHGFVGGPGPWDDRVPDRVPLRGSV